MTAQIGEKIIYNGDEYHIATEPLNPYLEKHNIEFKAYWTACWRGYYGSWEIEDDKLYLIDLRANLPINDKETKEVGIDYLFPGQEKVFADWFTGEIRITYGKILKYVHMAYESIYEKEMFLKIENGRLVGRRDIENDENTKSLYDLIFEE